MSFDPVAYSGEYNPAGQGFVSGPTAVDLAPGGYTLGVADGQGFSFTVAANGDVTSDNPAAASSAGSTLTFNTTTINVDPAAFGGEYTVARVAPFDSGLRSFVVVPGVNYRLGVADGQGFSFTVAANGDVISDNPAAASSFDNTLTFNTTTINVDPAAFGGAYTVARVAPFDSGLRSFVVVPGVNYRMGVAEGQGFSFTVAANGDVTSDNPAAASGAGGTLTFNTTTINVDPTSYTGQYAVGAVSPSVSGPQSFVVVPGVNYRMVIGTTSAFSFEVDTSGVPDPSSIPVSVGGSTFTFLLSPAGGDILWIRQFGSARGTFDLAQDVDSNGNVYVTGRVDGTIFGQTSAGSTDAFVRKYDTNGTEIWTRQFGTAGFDNPPLISVDNTGVYVAGSVGGTLPGQISAGSTDAFVRKYDTNGIEIWTRQFGTTGFDQIRDVTVDVSGVYVAGSTPGTLPGQSSTGSVDAFVRKYDSNGGEIWTRQFGTTGFDQATGISVDSSGVYVGGSVNGVLPGQTGGGGTDGFVRKYDSSGTEIWTRQFGAGASDGVQDIAVDTLGGVYIAAFKSGDSLIRKYDTNGNEIWTDQFFPPGVLGVTADSSGVYIAGRADGALPGQTSAGSTDAFVRKYDDAGTEIWTRQFGTSAFDLARGVAVDSSGVYVAGSTNGTLPGQTSSGFSDAFVRKYDASGAEIWTRQFGSGVPASDNAQAVDADGNVYVGGFVAGALPGQPWIDGFDAYVRKYDANGAELWTRQFGTSSNDLVHAIASNSSAVYVAGRTGAALPGQTSFGGNDAFVRRFDANGTELWTRQFGTSVNDEILGVAVDASGVYVAGFTSGSLPGQANAGGNDAFVRKYDENGTELWTRQFGGSQLDDARDVSTDSLGGVYVAGRTRGLPWQTGSGGQDAYVRKFDNSGNEVWTRQFGTSADDDMFSMSADASGIYIAGETLGAFQGQSSAGGRDAFVRKYNTNGNHDWTRQFGGLSTDRIEGTAADSSGVYLAGLTFGALPGQTSLGGQDAFVRAYDPSGAELWTRQIGTSSFDAALGVSVDSSAIYIAGITGGTFPTQTSAGLTDAFVAKLTKSSLTNQPPVAVDDVAGEAAVTEDGAPGPVDITADILANDFDPDSDPLTVVAFDDSSITAGILNLTSGMVTFDPNGQFESLGVGQNATQTFDYTIDDGNGGQDSATVDLVINGVNDDPTVAADQNPVSINEGLSATNTGSFDDIDSPDNVSISASVGSITSQDAGNSGSWSWKFNSSDGPGESQQVTITADDGNSGTTETTFQLNVLNVPPTITSLDVPLDPVDINDQSSFSVEIHFTDPAGTLDEPYTCRFDMDDDGMPDAIVGSVTGTSCSTQLSYGEPGVFTVKATVTDKDGDPSDPFSASDFIVVYDPDGGFVTGGGWIDSPLGACTFEDCTAGTTGKANFGFVSKYKNGATVPTGSTEFQFKAGNLNFHSTSYDWLVIAGKKAMYKGDGTVNGVDGFTFQLNAIDGDLPGGDGIDTFRIKIKQTGGGVIYDNQSSAGDNDDPTTELGGGNIKIHKQNNLVLDASNDKAPATGVELTQPLLDAAVTEAIAYWAQQGLTSEQFNTLRQLDVRIADLAGSVLGSAVPTDGTIWIDRDAAGFGWNSNTSDRETVNSGGIDLLSAVAHELGHMLGYEHDLLGSALGVGNRQLPVIDSTPGDANRDGVFDRFDLIDVLAADKYLTGQPATWREGDWNADGLFDQRDIVSALQADRFRDVRNVDPTTETADALFAQFSRGR